MEHDSIFQQYHVHVSRTGYYIFIYFAIVSPFFINDILFTFSLSSLPSSETTVMGNNSHNDRIWSPDDRVRESGTYPYVRNVTSLCNACSMQHCNNCT